MDFAKLFPLPVVASAHGHKIDMEIYLVHLLMFLLFAAWALFFVIVLFKFRKKRNPQADYSGVKFPVAIFFAVAVALFEAVLLMGFSIPFLAEQVNALPNRPDTIEVRVVAEQFAWNIHYPGLDGVFGKTDVRFLDKQSNPVGLDPHDPKAKDDIVTINQLHLPIGRPALIHLRAKDVMHSFSIPVMRVKQDIIPGMSVATWFTPTQTGQFEIACAQLCGLGHYRMKGFLTVHSREDFDKWLDEQAAAVKEAPADDFWQ
ncbi:MAG: hypothetical protein A3G91_03505 [Omnitrophica WOR_2 bacterium RIFCSPLOWO2_12_FULL_50_9]|nr:MAG: hypothetical protein A3D87_00675 [Omnitrophica WOR_2 bacterium RIFCSPHIGHO2_02_FULL_50_17]OGX41033.1 MAG: hypothetical protein A3G91_03505 [Omnitrophica WOR_2 bacterium RIFCSPLOWO2_12_FULL_50_9]